MSTTKPANYSKGLPGVPMASLDAIQDQNTRDVLRAIVDGWHVRNGSSGDGNARFVTAAELGDLSGTVGGLSRSLSFAQQQDRSLTASQINRIITDLQASVMESVLFKEIGDRITLINQDFLDGLAAEAIARQAAITTEATIRQTADTSLASQITTVTAAVDTNAAAIQTEITARVNGDNAITNYVTTQLATVNGNISALQTSQTTTANNVAALSSTVTTLQATVGSNTTAIQTEATARVNVDNDIYSKYSVKIDTNGYVTGFGLISTANNSTPYSEFLVRADRFSIASPSGPGISPQVPFVVLTTTDSKGNTPGVYVDNAIIKNAAVGTLKLDGEAVTIPRFAELVVTGQDLTTSWSGDVCSVSYTVSGLGGAETARVVVIAVMQAYPTNNTITDLTLGIFADGTLNTSVASTYSENGISMANVGSWFVGNGTFTASVKVACFATGPGASSKSNNSLVTRLIVLTAKR